MGFKPKDYDALYVASALESETGGSLGPPAQPDSNNCSASEALTSPSIESSSQAESVEDGPVGLNSSQIYRANDHRPTRSEWPDVGPRIQSTARTPKAAIEQQKKARSEHKPPRTTVSMPNASSASKHARRRDTEHPHSVKPIINWSTPSKRRPGPESRATPGFQKDENISSPRSYASIESEQASQIAVRKNSFDWQLSLGSDFHNSQSSRYPVEPSHSRGHSAERYRLQEIPAEVSRMMGKVSKLLDPGATNARSHFKYTEVPPAMIPHREFVGAPMLHCRNTRERYTQDLIWCLSRRIRAVHLQGTTSNNLRVAAVLAMIRAKLRDGVLLPFRVEPRAKLDLKPTQSNPKNRRNQREFTAFAAFSAQLESAQRDSFELLDHFEGRASRPISPVSELPCELLEVDQITLRVNALQAAAHDLMVQLSMQSITLEGRAEEAAQLFRELQSRYSRIGFSGLKDSLSV